VVPYRVDLWITRRRVA